MPFFLGQYQQKKAAKYLSRFSHTQLAKGLLMCCIYSHKYNHDKGWISPDEFCNYSMSWCDGKGKPFTDESLIEYWRLNDIDKFFEFTTNWIKNQDLNELEAEISDYVSRKSKTKFYLSFDDDENYWL